MVFFISTVSFQTIQQTDIIFSHFWYSFLHWNEITDIKKRSLFNSTCLLTIQWCLPLTRGHLQPRVTFGHTWQEMAPHVARIADFEFPAHFEDLWWLIPCKVVRGGARLKCQIAL